jgi:hypothetical protein
MESILKEVVVDKFPDEPLALSDPEVGLRMLLNRGREYPDFKL